MPKGKPYSTTSPELLDAIRDCATRKLSMKQAAAELSTPAHSFTRSAIAGVAKRAKISFKGKGAPHSSPNPRVRKPPGFIRALASPLVEGVAKPTIHVKSPQPGCSWAGCTGAAEDGDMFCYMHARKPLLCT